MAEIFITRDMQIEDIVEKYPETIGPMQKMGIQCMLCGEPVWGTIEEKANDKGIENIDEIMAELNRIISVKQHQKD